MDTASRRSLSEARGETAGTGGADTGGGGLEQYCAKRRGPMADAFTRPRRNAATSARQLITPATDTAYDNPDHA